MGNTDEGQYYWRVGQYFQRWGVLLTMGNTIDVGQYRIRRWPKPTKSNTGDSCNATMGNTEDDGQYYRRWAILAAMGNTIDDGQYRRRWAILTKGNTDDGCNDEHYTEDDGQYYIDEGQYLQRWAMLYWQWATPKAMGNAVGVGQYLQRRWATPKTMGNTGDVQSYWRVG